MFVTISWRNKKTKSWKTTTFGRSIMGNQLCNGRCNHLGSATSLSKMKGHNTQIGSVSLHLIIWCSSGQFYKCFTLESLWIRIQSTNADQWLMLDLNLSNILLKKLKWRKNMDWPRISLFLNSQGVVKNFIYYINNAS